MLTNISIEKANEILLSQDIKINTINIPILESLGYVLG